VGKAPLESQRKIRNLGLLLALVFRIIMLFGIAYIAHITTPLFTIGSTGFSVRDIILFVGGLFLIAKSTLEIHHKLAEAASGHLNENKKPEASNTKKVVSNMIMQIIVIDIIFSIDSILTAVGLTEHVGTMILAVIISIIFMMIVSKAVGEFINKNPTIVMLALSFLIMIGMLLIADAFHFHVPRGYIYFAMGFSLMVEVLNLILINRLNRWRDKHNQDK
jgi:predicted tellurium resistance membrane protein TerC